MDRITEDVRTVILILLRVPRSEYEPPVVFMLQYTKGAYQRMWENKHRTSGSTQPKNCILAAHSSMTKTSAVKTTKMTIMR